MSEPSYRMTWGQIAWFITVLTGVMLTYADLKVQIAKLGFAQSDVVRRVEALERDNHRHEVAGIAREP